MALRFSEQTPAAPHVLIGSETVAVLPPDMPIPMIKMLLRMGDTSAAVTNAWAAVLNRLPQGSDDVKRRIADAGTTTEVLYTFELSQKGPSVKISFYV